MVQDPKPTLAYLEITSLKAIGDALDKFDCHNLDIEDYVKTNFAWNCMEMDFSKGFVDEVN